MTYWRIYHFKSFFSLSLIFVVLSLGLTAGGIVWICLDGVSWYLFPIILFGLCAIYSILFLYNTLFRRYKDAVKARGQFVKTEIFYDAADNSPYIKIAAKSVPLQGLYGKKLFKKFPEKTKIAAYYIPDEQTAILLQK